MAYKRRYFAGLPIMLPGKAAIEIPSPTPEPAWFKAGESYRILYELYTYEELVSLAASYGINITGLINAWIADGHRQTLKRFVEIHVTGSEVSATYLAKLVRTRALMETMTVQEAINTVGTETGDDEWGMGEIGEGHIDWRSDFFDEKLGVGIAEDVANPNQKWVYKLWYDEIIEANSVPEYPKTFYPQDKDKFIEGSDAWVALNAGRQVTLDETHSIIDVWDPVTKATYDHLGNKITDRENSYRVTPVKPTVEPYKAPAEKAPPETIAIPTEPTVPGKLTIPEPENIMDKINEIIEYLDDLSVFNDTVFSYFYSGLVMTQRYFEELAAAKAPGTQTENAKKYLEQIDQDTAALERGIT